MNDKKGLIMSDDINEWGVKNVFPFKDIYTPSHDIIDRYIELTLKGKKKIMPNNKYTDNPQPDPPKDEKINTSSQLTELTSPRFYPFFPIY